MPVYVFSLGLIPVQDWIGEARRSRDLRVGSALLGFLTGRILKTLGGTARTLVPYDDPDDPNNGYRRFLDTPSLSELLKRRDAYGIPNRASGYFEAATEANLREVFGSLEAGVVEHEWKKLKDYYLGTERHQTLGRPEAARFRAAIEPYLDAYLASTLDGSDCPFSLVWVAAPAGAGTLPDLTSDAGRAQAQEDLAAIDDLFRRVKRSRPARPWKHGAPVGKCTQCGRREAMGPREPDEKRSAFAAWNDWQGALARDPWLEKGYRLEASERLCYVCLLKRLAGYAPGAAAFPSTGEVASAVWEAEVAKGPETRRALAAFHASVEADLDLGRPLYLAKDRLKALYGDGVVSARDELRTAIATHNQGLDGPELPLQPPSYLALLAFDGDDMGRLVQGDPIGVPRKMEQFAALARRRLADARGEVFYLAGDEGLAMVPAAEGLAVAGRLREAFGEVFGGDEGDGAATLSVGLAFFDFARPMAGAIRTAREALDEAKRQPGKNALGVSVETASGSRWGFTASWGPAWKRLELLVEWVRTDELSISWAYDLERFLENLSEEAWKHVAVRRAAREEARRLFYRRCEPQRKEKRGEPGPKEKKGKREALAEMWSRLEADLWWETPDFSLPEKAPQQLHLIGFLARQGLGRAELLAGAE